MSAGDVEVLGEAPEMDWRARALDLERRLVDAAAALEQAHQAAARALAEADSWSYFVGEATRALGLTDAEADLVRSARRLLCDLRRQQREEEAEGRADHPPGGDPSGAKTTSSAGETDPPGPTPPSEVYDLLARLDEQHKLTTRSVVRSADVHDFSLSLRTHYPALAAEIRRLREREAAARAVAKLTRGSCPHQMGGVASWDCQACVASALLAYAQKAVDEEREACAQIAHNLTWAVAKDHADVVDKMRHSDEDAEQIEEEIRARGSTSHQHARDAALLLAERGRERNDG